MRRLLPAALVLLAAPAALAEGPVGPGPGQGSPEEEIARLALKISKALKENEEALSKIARGEKGEAKPVDIRVPPSGSSSSSSSASSESEGAPKGENGGGGQKGSESSKGDPSGAGGGGDPREALRGSVEQGREISSAIDELLKQAGKMGGGGGGGGHQQADQGKPEDGTEDPNDPKSKDGKDPKCGEKTDKPPEVQQGPKPPPSSKDPPREEDPRAYFLAKLPDKVKEAVLNGDFDQVPEKYRDLVAEWTKALGEKDRKEAEKPADGK